MRYYLVIDCEMTGNDPTWHEIIQLGAVLCDNRFEEIGQYLSNVCPENEEGFSVYSEQIHGLSWDALQSEPPIYEVLESFEAWILDKICPNKQLQDRKLLKDVIICGHSVLNDVNFLQFAYTNENMEWPYSYTLLDTHQLSFYLFEIFRFNKVAFPKSRSLKSIAAFFGYEREDMSFHNALEDAILTKHCLKKMMIYTQKLKLES